MILESISLPGKCLDAIDLLAWSDTVRLKANSSLLIVFSCRFVPSIITCHLWILQFGRSRIYLGPSHCLGTQEAFRHDEKKGKDAKCCHFR
jgi:hypothetical protein